MNILYLCAKCGTRGQGPEPCSGCGNPMEAFVLKDDLKPLVENVQRLMELQQQQKALIDKYIGHVQKNCTHRWKAVGSKMAQAEHYSLTCALCGAVSLNPGAIQYYKRCLKRTTFFPDIARDGLFIPAKNFAEEVSNV